ncbi:MAG TPA: hypothetical protein VF771_21405, partial [Longimicrobiaceae bacterium]
MHGGSFALAEIIPHRPSDAMSSYQAPLDRLRGLGAEPALRRVWPDYRHLGLTVKHVPGLIGIATDSGLLAADEKDRARWAPLHAWRALAQLRA